MCRKNVVMILRSVIPLGALALSLGLNAQIPVPGDPPGCGGMERKFPSWSVPPLAPRYQDRAAVQTSTDLCSTYTHSGWKRTVRFRLGEGSEDYKELLEIAIERWNDALEGFTQEPVIEISPLRPTNYSLRDDFWQQRNQNSELDESDSLIDDGESVIYFKGNDPDNLVGGFAYSRWNSSEMVEADIYINLTDTEKYGPYLVNTQEFVSIEGMTAYIPVLSIYITILHEIGHALGLNHVPVSGNIMSYNYMPYMHEMWKVPGLLQYLEEIVEYGSPTEALRQGLFSEFVTTRPELSPRIYFEELSDIETFILGMFTNTAGLGEQDRMSLLCAYEFSDWNH